MSTTTDKPETLPELGAALLIVAEQLCDLCQQTTFPLDCEREYEPPTRGDYDEIIAKAREVEALAERVRRRAGKKWDDAR